MKSPLSSMLFVVLVIVCVAGVAPAQRAEPEPESPPPSAEKESEPNAPKIAPPFDLPGTGDTRLTLKDARAGAMAIFFYGDDVEAAAYTIVAASCDKVREFEALKAQLCLVGKSPLESHEELLGRRACKRPLFHDKLGETQLAFGLDPRNHAWVVISTKGEIVDSRIFSGHDSESVYEAIAAALAALRSLVPPDAPNFIAVLGQPIEGVRDVATMPDGRVTVLTSTQMIHIIGDTNEVVEVEGPPLESVSVDSSGLLYVAAGSQVQMVHDSEGMQPVYTEGDDESGGIIECITCQASGIITFLRRGKLFGILPATGRVVPMYDEPGTVDLVSTPENTVVVLRNKSPYMQVLDAERNVADLPVDARFVAPPAAGVADPAGRIFVALSGVPEILVLDQTGKVAGSFPVRGGGIEGPARFLSIGAGYLDAAVKDAASGKFRILRFAL